MCLCWRAGAGRNRDLCSCHLPLCVPVECWVPQCGSWGGCWVPQCGSWRGCWVPQCGSRIVPPGTFPPLVCLCPHIYPQGPHPDARDQSLLSVNLLHQSREVTLALPEFVAMPRSCDTFLPHAHSHSLCAHLMRTTVGVQLIGSVLGKMVTSPNPSLLISFLAHHWCCL